ncbi:MAG: hypothetical protein HWN51_07590 [Desulfobacterales bacterium]|nr:hypothetical protein [Desulfobacterales bacterium]
MEQIRMSTRKEKKAVSVAKPRHGSKLEETVVAMMLQCPQILSSFDAEEIVESLETTVLKKVGQMILGRVRANQPVTSAELIGQTQDAQIRNVISSLLLEETPWDRDSCLKIVGQYQARLRKQQGRVLLRRIREAEETNNQKLLHQLLAEKQKRAQQRLTALRGGTTT